MNVGGMSSDNPSWSSWAYITFAGSFVCVLVLWFAKWIWDWRPGSPLKKLKTEPLKKEPEGTFLISLRNFLPRGKQKATELGLGGEYP
jgi:hypothetical protein